MLTASDTFPSIANSADWQYVRTTTNFQSNGPVTDVNSDQIRCYERNPGTGASGTYTVAAGSSIAYNAKASISHPGPMAFYIAKVPAGQTAASWDGKGQVWSKIYQDMPKLGGSMTWPTQSTPLAQLTSPKCPLTDLIQTPAPSRSPSPAVCRTATTCCVPSTSVFTRQAALVVPSSTSPAPRSRSPAAAARTARRNSCRSLARTRRLTLAS